MTYALVDAKAFVLQWPIKSKSNEEKQKKWEGAREAEKEEHEAEKKVEEEKVVK